MSTAAFRSDGLGYPEWSPPRRSAITQEAANLVGARTRRDRVSEEHCLRALYDLLTVPERQEAT